MEIDPMQRKIVAILAADIVGYSRLAGADEDRILARLRALRSDLIDPIIAVHQGRVVKRTGDGALVEFLSVVNAVRCAVEVQNGIDAPIGTAQANAAIAIGFMTDDRAVLLAAAESAAAKALSRAPEHALAHQVVRAYGFLGEMPLPPWQIVKERRATFAATPAQLARRPGATTQWRNLVLAGDWTDTGLPATIEGAIRSGFRAAESLGMPGMVKL